MSPTCALLGIPPRALTAQFSNSKGGIFRSCFSVHGRFRTTKPWPVRQSFSSSRMWHTSRNRLAMTRQAVGEMSMPIHCRPKFSAATSAVPQPQKASSTMSFGLLLALMIRSSKGQRLLGWIAETFLRGLVQTVDVRPNDCQLGPCVHRGQMVPRRSVEENHPRCPSSSANESPRLVPFVHLRARIPPVAAKFRWVISAPLRATFAVSCYPGPVRSPVLYFFPSAPVTSVCGVFPTSPG